MSCRFVVMSDTHFIMPPTDFEGTWWNRTTHRFSHEMGEALVELVNSLSPDFAVHCGDFIDQDSQKDYYFGLEFMNQLNCPWFGVLGNHDAWSVQARERFRMTFGCREGTCSYSRELGGLKFLFLDVTNWYGKNGECFPCFSMEDYNSGNIIGMGPSVNDLLWMEKELKKTSIPAVLVTHAPVAFKDVYPLKTLPYGKPVKGPTTPPSDFIDDIVDREKIFRLIQDYRAVKTCFAGHWHNNDAVICRGTLYVLTGALREFPYEIRLVEYSRECLKVTTHGLKVPNLREISYVKDWGNKWVESESDGREFIFSF